MLADDGIYPIVGRTSEGAFNLVCDLVQTNVDVVGIIVRADRHLRMLQGLIPIMFHYFLFFMKICFRLDNCIYASMVCLPGPEIVQYGLYLINVFGWL